MRGRMSTTTDTVSLARAAIPILAGTLCCAEAVPATTGRRRLRGASHAVLQKATETTESVAPHLSVSSFQLLARRPVTLPTHRTADADPGSVRSRGACAATAFIFLSQIFCQARSERRRFLAETLRAKKFDDAPHRYLPRLRLVPCPAISVSRAGKTLPYK
jgi:hypothetical protein